MKRIICVCICLAMILSMSGMIWETTDTISAAQNTLADQKNVIGDYRDGAMSLSQPDCGLAESKEIAPSPEKTSIVYPTAYTFLMINLKNYSGGMRSDKKDLPLDQNFFDSLHTTLENARKSGVMVGVRFRYTNDGTNAPEPLTWEHLIEMFEDIKSSGILTEYADIISWCELGTLGAFGEQHSTRYGDYGYSDELIDLYLNMLPKEIPILLRTTGRITHWVNAKLGTNYNTSTIQNMTKDVCSIYAKKTNNISNYYSGDGKDFSTGNLLSDDLVRLGLYNDGYMATNWDYGTFTNRTNETAFLNFQSNVPYGGEYGTDDFLQIYYGDYTNVWYPINAIPEMYYTNLSYLHGGPWKNHTAKHTFSKLEDAQVFMNRLYQVYDNIGREDFKNTVKLTEGTTFTVDYTVPGLDATKMTEDIESAAEKKAGVQLDLSEYYGMDTRKFILDHLGYRFVVRSSKLTSGAIAPDDNFTLELEVENTGFHKIYQKKEVELLLVNNARSYRMLLSDIDIRTWNTGRNTLKETVKLPADISGGQWKVYLRISPENKNAEDDTKYCVKFANNGIFHAELGANLIGHIIVNAEEAQENPSYVDPRPTGVYYDNMTSYAADTDYLPFLQSPYIFRTDGLYGFTIMFRLDGIAENSEINLTRWETTGSGGQLHSFNWFFKNNPKYGYGKTFNENGYYLMYCPFYSIGPNNGVSSAGNTKFEYFYCNAARTIREDKNTPTSLNGNEAAIMPLGIVEGAVTGYDVTFHYKSGYHYTGTYDFKNTNKAVSENCQFLTAPTLLSIYQGEIPTEYSQNGITYRFVGWTMKKGYRQGLIHQHQIALGTLDLYPYYEPDITKTNLNVLTNTLNGNTGESGIIYTLDEATMTAMVGTNSSWAGNSGFSGNGTDSCIIPAYVISKGVKYKVTGISEGAFESCTGLKSIYIPSTVTEIGTSAFRGISENVKVYTYKGNAAAEYMKEQGIICEIVPEPEPTAGFGIEINEYQISTTLGGHRVVYSIVDPNKEVETSGLVFGIAEYASNADMVVGGTNKTVMSHQSTERGKSPVVYSKLEGAQSFITTMKFIDDVKYYSDTLLVRAYAKLKNGQYVYSDIQTYSIYDVADRLYQSRKMNTFSGHEYLFHRILSKVNPSYKEEAYDCCGQ